METEAARKLREARRSGDPDFVTTPTRVESTGLVIPPIHRETRGGVWRVQEDWTYDGPGYRLTVPQGWESDLASVPKVLHPWLNSFQFGVAGPLAHDFVYEHGGRVPEGTCVPYRVFTRREADDLLLALMRAERVAPRFQRLGYLFTRALGWTHWEG